MSVQVTPKIREVVGLMDMQISKQCDCTRHSAIRFVGINDEFTGTGELITTEYSHGEDQKFPPEVSAFCVSNPEDQKKDVYTPEMERNHRSFDFSDNGDIRDLIVEFKKNGMSAEEVQIFFKMAELGKETILILEVFEAPLEVFLTHSEYEVRAYGLKKQELKSGISTKSIAGVSG